MNVMHDARGHARILAEKACPIATSPKYKVNRDLTEINEGRPYECSSVMLWVEWDHGSGNENWSKRQGLVNKDLKFTVNLTNMLKVLVLCV